jgi:hypothetical protein
MRLPLLIAALALFGASGCVVHTHARATPYRTTVEYRYLGAHPVPDEWGEGWCFLDHDHVHDYAPVYSDYTYRGGVYVYARQPMIWYVGYHPVPSGGHCSLTGRHSHHYHPGTAFANDYSWDRSQRVYVYRNPPPPGRGVSPVVPGGPPPGRPGYVPPPPGEYNPPPGHGGIPPGHGGTPPGHNRGGPPPGHINNPGQGGPPGHGRPPGSRTPPGHDDDREHGRGNDDDRGGHGRGHDDDRGRGRGHDDDGGAGGGRHQDRGQGAGPGSNRPDTSGASHGNGQGHGPRNGQGKNEDDDKGGKGKSNRGAPPGRGR